MNDQRVSRSLKRWMQNVRLEQARERLAKMERRGKPKDIGKPAPETGLADWMFDRDGFVLPQFREHVARLRCQPQMSDLGEIAHTAESRKGD